MPDTAPINISGLDRIVVRPKREMRLVEKTSDGYVLAEASTTPQLHESFSHDRIRELLQVGAMRIERGWYHEDRAKARLFAGVNSMAQLPPTEQKQIFRRHHYVTEFVRRETSEGSKVKRTDASIAIALKAIDDDFAPTGRCDQPRTVHKRPCARTFRRWLKSYEKHGADPLALRTLHRRCGNQLSNMHPEAIRLLNEHLMLYCDERRRSIKKVHSLLAVAVRDCNRERELRGVSPIDVPAKSTLRARIAALNQFEVYASRHGIPAARAKFAANSGGLDVDRPLQHVQIDEWRIQLHTIVEGLGIGADFTEKDRIALRKERLYACVVIDVATRCVVGMRLSRKSDTPNAIATLAMTVIDKTDIAKASGCLSDWPMHGPAHVMSPDAGANFIDEEFRARLADLKCTYENAPAGLSHLRGHIERVFGTAHTNLIEEFPGRSFSNVVDKGAYKAEDRAAALSADVPKIFVRWVVDHYHHTPHVGLCGETPYCAWQRLTQKFGVDPSPNRDQRREIFGVELERVLDQNGVRVQGLFYQSEEMQRWRRQLGDTKVRVRVDENDIGYVSVWLGDDWITVPSVRTIVRGVHLDTWLESVRDLRRRFAEGAKMYEHIVDESIRAIAKMADDAMRRVAIDRTSPTAAELDQTETGLLLGFQIEDDADDADDDHGDGGILGRGIPVANSTPPTDPTGQHRPTKARDDDYGLDD
ncbi:Mu transposase C-terminal domain-containing protein [Tardiphaga sp.]|uniref:Mu transposase C-terminal domain-containing protein n=1 Tax=Tardiphaga sp. TaxID=1926292 RepID=UPI0037D9FBDF